MPLKSQTLEIEAHEIEKKMNELAADIETRAAQNTDDPDIATRSTERAALWPELNRKKTELITQLRLEDAEGQAAMAKNADTSGWTPELREWHQLGQRTSMAEYMRAGAQQRAVAPGTPEHEYNTHVFGSNFAPGEFPLEQFLDRSETFSMEAWQAAESMRKEQEERTEITGTSNGAGNLSFVDRIMADSEGAYLRAQYPAVGPGRHSFPRVNGTGNLGAVIARGTAETVAGGITIENADAERIQHSWEVARVDELHMPGIMEYLVRDLRMGLMAGLDNKIVDDLVSGLTDTDLTSGTTLTAAGLMQGAFAAVNGRAAFTLNDIRVLAANTSAASQTTAYERIGALIGGSIADGVFNFMANVRASAHMGAAASGEDELIYILNRSAAARLIVPTWRRAEILRDTGRLQLAGTVTLTGAMFATVIVAGTDLWSRRTIETQ